MASRGVTSFSTFSAGCDLVTATVAVGAGSDIAEGAILFRLLTRSIGQRDADGKMGLFNPALFWVGVLLMLK
jgi:hypothetical protein